MRSVHPLQRRARRVRPWLPPIGVCVVVAALAATATAAPCTLDKLLVMPLERLLQLQIEPRAAGHHAGRVDGRAERHEV